MSFLDDMASISVLMACLLCHRDLAYSESCGSIGGLFDSHRDLEVFLCLLEQYLLEFCQKQVSVHYGKPRGFA